MSDETNRGVSRIIGLWGGAALTILGSSLLAVIIIPAFGPLATPGIVVGIAVPPWWLWAWGGARPRAAEWAVCIGLLVCAGLAGFVGVEARGGTAAGQVGGAFVCALLFAPAVLVGMSDRRVWRRADV
ncbi:hypothetical protein GCM10023224_04820 [Streptomonospora halophila]|uniref:SPW repeat-containing protein n=1 Tax=Streptomonospora halophila TaxID=427369 RepID=A0ABP9GBN8_9ACTN